MWFKKRTEREKKTEGNYDKSLSNSSLKASSLSLHKDRHCIVNTVASLMFKWLWQSLMQDREGFIRIMLTPSI